MKAIYIQFLAFNLHKTYYHPFGKAFEMYENADKRDAWLMSVRTNAHMKQATKLRVIELETARIEKAIQS